MTSNGTLATLNDHLFAQLDRLSKTDMTPEEIEQEAQRAEAIVSIADQITGNSRVQLAAAKLFAEHGHHVLEMLPRIGQVTKKTDAPE